MDIGAVIRHLRTEQGLSQNDLADLAQINNSTISLIEHGHRQPSLEVLSKIAYALQMKPWHIVFIAECPIGFSNTAETLDVWLNREMK